jgi:NADH-quinone oxidoreductase subunit L
MHMTENNLIAILILAPFIGFLINGLRVNKHNYKVAGIIATSAVFISFLCSIFLFIQLLELPEEQRTLTANFMDWIHVGDFKVDFNFVVDQISIIMLLVITGIGTLIHLFSIDYMLHDKSVARYFAYLNLFIFNMLLLVLGGNLLVMFAGWEGVGLCSYLLIGFWFNDEAKAAAGMKAFLTNRIGDAAFLLGLFMIFVSFGTINISEIIHLVPSVPELGWTGPLTLGCLFLFIGATGKSAQIPLYVWLPDAMAGPTPVSALIHAATMVTAGIYMIVRLNPLFMAAPNSLFVVACVGATTAILAASIGITQWDIKKILAYSTVSQLGYMFTAVGVGAFGAAMFHLMTHAFFKALMFLGSGSVIHAMHEEQDIRKMGGLKKYMPITHITFVIGWLAIIGTPFFSGFFSKDEILWMSFHSPMGHQGFWIVGVIGAAMTAFYMTRLMALTFWGESRVAKNVHPHESPLLMTIPLIILAILSFAGGWIGIPHVISEILPWTPENLWEHWLHLKLTAIPGLVEAEASQEWLLMGASVGLASVSAFLAYRLYAKKSDIPSYTAKALGPIYKLVFDKFYVDELYSFLFIKPLVEFSKNLWMYVDVNFIDRSTFWITDVIKGAGQMVRTLQNGNLQQYALYMAMGLVIFLSFILMR